jgi:hypothetical protein
MSRERRVISLDPGSETEADATESDSSHETRVNTLAKQVRTVYCICVRELTGKESYGTQPMPKWDGGVNKFGTRSQPIWPRISNHILQLDADPLEYVRAQFSVITNPTQFTKPNMLYNSDAVVRWRAYKDNALRNIGHHVRADLNHIRIESMPLMLNMQWSEQKAIAYVLCKRSCSVSPLVRYCVCVTKGMDGLAQLFREHALLQYMFQMTNYDSLLGERIPNQLRTDAMELKRRLVGQ